MNAKQSIWSEEENRRFPLPAPPSLMLLSRAMEVESEELWSDFENSRFVAPTPDPEVALHATVREYDEYYLTAVPAEQTEGGLPG